MDLNKVLRNKKRNKLKTILFPESYDKRILSAVENILQEKTAKVILISTGKNPPLRIKNNINLKILNINSGKEFLNEYHHIKLFKDVNKKLSQSVIELKDPLTFACMLLRNKQADGIIAGSNYTTSEVLKNAISIVGLKKNNKTVSSFFIFTFPKDHFLKDKVYAYADCGVIPDPTAEQLSDIAIQTSENYYKLTGKKPKVAFLSFSTKGSSKDKSVFKILEALEITRHKKPDLLCDGEIQFDAAFIPEIAKRKNPDSVIKGDANVFIFPDLNSGNIAYKITERIGRGQATGPIIQGLAKPVMDLSRGCSAEDIINMTKIIINS